MALLNRCCLLAALLLPLQAPAQARLNLALEPEANHRQPLVLWSRQVFPGTKLAFDTVTFRQGRGSLRLDLEPAASGDDPAYAALYTLYSFPIDSVRGRLVTVSAWVRTRGFAGRGGVYAYAHTPDEDGKDRRDNFELLPPETDWRRLELTLPVKPTATEFGLGLRVSGSGQIWFDDLQVRINGRLFQDSPQPGSETLLLSPEERQTPNWDFERPFPPAARPDPARALVRTDSLLSQHGRRSLRVALAPGASLSGQPAPVVYLGTLSVEKMRGKLLTVSGFWRQAAPEASPVAANSPPTSAKPAFVYTRFGNDGQPGSPPQWSAGVFELPAPAPPGPEWAPFTLTIPIADDQFLSAIALGLRPAGAAPVLLDNFTFSLDGRPYVPAPPPTPPAPTAAEVAWLRRALVPIPAATAAANASVKTPDLAALGQLIGNARVVGLGEVTHGSGSIFEMKHRLIQYLVEQKGFTGFVLETSADCAPLNAYLQTGQGDPAALLSSFGIWNTQEVLSLVRYLRAYNQHHAAKVRLADMDMQRPDLVLARLRQQASPSDEFTLSHLRELTTTVAALPAGGGADFDPFQHPDQPADARLQTLRRLLNELRAGLDTRAKLVRQPGELTPAAQTGFLHNLRLLEQGATFRCLPLKLGADYRDACMAENVAWLSQNLSPNPNGAPTKLAMWAHNAHVAISAQGQRPMGEWLKTSFGAGYLALGFAFGQGSYTAEGGGRMYTASAQPATPGTYEAWFQAANVPAFVLDMRRLELTDDNAWLFQQQRFRDIGIQESSRNFRPHELRSEFDAVLFQRISTPAQHLK